MVSDPEDAPGGMKTGEQASNGADARRGLDQCSPTLDENGPEGAGSGSLIIFWY